ncbi:SDR family oxidoreductase [Rhodothermus marinus]|uniref:SDR family oxidoreductase n=1 Tax=Rhodothermus marinus TaxID=29549 RepID=UPI0037CA2060
MAGIIGVTGASGHLGRRVVELLLENVSAERIRALTRHPEKIADLAERGVSVGAGDFARPDELARALEGVERLLLVSTDDLHPGARVRLHRQAIEAARKAGVRYVAYTSATRADTNPVNFMRDHAETEAALRESGLAWTFLRNNLYAETLLMVAPVALQTGVLQLPAGDGRVGFVAREDCARIAVAVLLDPAHEGKIYEVTGPEALGYAEAAAILSELSGRPVRYEPVSPEAYRQAMAAAGLPDFVIDAMTSMYQGVAQGVFDLVSSAVQDVTGRAPQTVRQALEAQRATLQPAG